MSREKKLQSKPWITKGILTSINANNIMYRKYCRIQNQSTKEELYKSLKFNHDTLNKLTRLTKAIIVYLRKTKTRSLKSRMT